MVVVLEKKHGRDGLELWPGAIGEDLCHANRWVAYSKTCEHHEGGMASNRSRGRGHHVWLAAGRGGNVISQRPLGLTFVLVTPRVMWLILRALLLSVQ